MTLEEQAEEVGYSKPKLRKRLNEARGVLAVEFQKTFKNATFDFKNKRLVSSCKQYALQWSIRERPDDPPSYDNQQTNKGIVTLIRLIDTTIKQPTFIEQAEEYWRKKGKKMPTDQASTKWQKMYSIWYLEKFPWIASPNPGYLGGSLRTKLTKTKE